MFKIDAIRLIQFRNCHAAHHRFEGKVTAICGRNGVGKTNLLDAVHFLCLTKSYFNQTDAISVAQGHTGFSITGTFCQQDQHPEVSVILRENGKKELWMDKVQVTPFSKHIGKLPLVFVAPDDVVLINGGSEERRKFLDTVLSQSDPEYLNQLIRYNKCLQERNRYLKSLPHPGAYDAFLLDAFDEQLAGLGGTLVDKRATFLDNFLPRADELFAHISLGKERPVLGFEPSLTSDNYLNGLQKSRDKDLVLQRTSVGIHRDDLSIQLQGLPFKQIASQGQKKSLLFALKLAEFDFLKSHFGHEPILMLDDIFEKLDQIRLKKLLEWVCVHNHGQVLLTDTHEERIVAAMRDISVPFQLIKLD